ncbi:hypothetical protein [Baekduia sp. Peel2402]|uniref:hypothetical protein n=1 Tax=Baekduia sp. Peel2402 TaxID=3458296 RepID=UPI00403E60A7
MRTRLVLFTVVITLIAAASASAAPAATLPQRTVVGPDQGVQASVAGTSVTIRFTGVSAAWGKKRAGKQALVSCERSPALGLLFREGDAGSSLGGDGSAFGDASSASSDLSEYGLTQLSSSGASVKAKVEDAAKVDFCQVMTDPALSADIAWAAVTPRGVVALEELQRGLRLTDVLYASAPKGTYRAAADVVALGGGEVVALDDPNGTPPAGKIGYWSKGRAVSVVSASATARRVAIQDIGDGMLRTNALDALLSWKPAQAPTDDEAPASAGVFGLSDTTGDSDDDSEKQRESLSADEGVFAHTAAGKVVFRFTGKAAKVYRRLAGRRVDVICIKAPARPLLGEAVSFGAPVISHARVAAHGGTIRGKAPAGHDDICEIQTADGDEVTGALLTPAARRYLFDVVVPVLILLDGDVPWDIAARTATRYPGVATILSSHPGVVGLGSPGAAVKAGKIGVWTDADQQALIAYGGPDGLRYVIADEGAGRVRTNVFTGLLGLMASLTGTARTTS